MSNRRPSNGSANTRRRGRRPLIWERIGQRAAGQPPCLTVDRIVRIALGLADREGLETISMRHIAAELGSGVMSLYHYVPSKNDLLDLLLDSAIGEIVVPGQPSGNWRADLHAIAMGTRACLKRHPWLSVLLNTRPAFGPNRLAQFEFVLAVVSRLGLDLRSMRQMVSSLYIYTLGFFALEFSEAVALRRGEGEVGSPYIKELIATGAFPNLERLVKEGQEFPCGDEAFANGLNVVLDGMAAMLPPSARQ